MTALHELERRARGAPLLQVAFDGWWEHAAAAALPTSPEEADRLLGSPGRDDVAVEVLRPGPPVVFVGARFGGADGPPLRQLAARADWTPTRALELLAPGPLGPAVRAELGAVNAWRSIRPLPLALDAQPAAIARALADRPRLATCTVPVALEVVHDQPHEAWWAIEVSVPRGRGHEVRVERVSEALGWVVHRVPGPDAHDDDPRRRTPQPNPVAGDPINPNPKPPPRDRRRT